MIIGAGISGLTLAASLGHRGIQSCVLEKKDQLSDSGFGIQISPNASRILKRIGILDQLEDIWIEPEDFVFRSGSTLKELSRFSCKNYSRNNWGGIYGVVKRHTLQKILLNHIQTQPLARLHLSTHITHPDCTQISKINNQKPDLLVGADGLNSNIRHYIDTQPITFSGDVVLRCLIPQNNAPEFIDFQSVNIFFGPDSHLVTYPLREDNTINMVFVSSKHTLKDISFLKRSEIHKEWFVKHLTNWHQEIIQLILQINDTHLYPLFECECKHWHNKKNAVLIGDAAHTLLPFAAQGANMAIEDAYALSYLLGKKTIPAAISAYQKVRAVRVKRIRYRTKLNQLLFHMHRPASLFRNAGLRLGIHKPLHKSLDWIYQYKIPE
ncbi:FAD-dependent monooxygenase [Candidatus Liberibacter asiaticus]|uniref:Monooxygenase FAD-binding protein n=3 Tax=Liberibacter asiaticus TaxID=34021 RepID=C6XH96_LIBAP|nr:FAD-dependent monooxygenase [Candidatus Liberibacter asiaticus]ACT56641.1 monooxygenase FAD-binding protein [Candidatus Liberibacter asiaticus str. psy62]AGH16408.1 monooxygenase FAD-binding protein [Candidatus Liberibacter asiaticus str. gxpsy]ALK06824.1 NAD(P)-binding protein [Candidatus Liberibacter asiaticus]ASK52292.1 monooxygenase [Candidatus Liberibacter asiaticus]AWL13614.1 monooxygenase [Candidatus Liberibacter asiaticus]